MPCETCKDTGWTGFHKLMGRRKVFVHQLCTCPSAEAAAARYEQNLKARKAGRAVETNYQQQVTGGE